VIPITRTFRSDGNKEIEVTTRKGWFLWANEIRGRLVGERVWKEHARSGVFFSQSEAQQDIDAWAQRNAMQEI
jgi:hypothetical protein